MSDYAGDVSSSEAWEMLKSDDSTLLVDVRTSAEWNFVGVPDLSQLSKNPILVQWLSFPDSKVNPQFEEQVAEAGADAGLGRDKTILFLCRSGARSAAAATLMTERGYTQCYNISDGFEGDPDETRRRGTVNGWKCSGLPWTQS